MIDIYNRLGFKAFETMTEKPYADNDLKDSDLLEENTPHENLFALAQAAKEYGSLK